MFLNKTTGTIFVSLFILQSKQEIHRRSARLRSTKYKAPASEKKVSTKGKGRRHIFKLKNVSDLTMIVSPPMWVK